MKSVATIGGGCFWCVEAVFQLVQGVEKVISGYAGGNIKNPTYREVCSGLTGHAEVCQITYEDSIISYDEVLEIFFKTHDPTQLNRQGNDVGTQYRSVIFYHDESQKEKAEYYKEKLQESGIFSQPIVTEISPLPIFYEAEDYHQNYFNNHPTEGYCSYVVRPKVEKFKQIFPQKMRN